jgi:hypothetical protein
MHKATFINYSHPSDTADRRNRRIVASYIGTHYRNRSRPSARKGLKSTGSSPPDSIDGLKPQNQTPRSKTTTPRSRSRTSSPKTPSLLAQPLVLDHDRHGYRADPFRAYPIEFRECIPPALDYCLFLSAPQLEPTLTDSAVLQFYGPTHIIRPEVLSAEEGIIALHQYVQYALQNSVMFDALVALAQANLSFQSYREGWDKDALFHYSRSVQRLREVLSQPDAYLQDATLFAIIALMGVDVSTGTSER